MEIEIAELSVACPDCGQRVKPPWQVIDGVVAVGLATCATPGCRRNPASYRRPAEVTIPGSLVREFVESALSSGDAGGDDE